MINSQPTVRPYFIPPDIDFAALPESFRAAYEALIEPAYEELVLHAHNALERCAGATFVLLATMELLDQFGLGRRILDQGDEDADERHAKLEKCLRVIKAKDRWAHFLFKLQSVRSRDFLANKEPLTA